MQTFSKQQITAAEEIILQFNQQNAERWVTLSAQMQSGKTDTFYLAAFQLLHMNVISHVVIMCGSAEKELKRQVLNRKEVIRKYRKYIRGKIQDVQPDITADDLIDQIDYIIYDIDNDDNYSYMWNCDMQKYLKSKSSEPYKNTLFIWEESHYAQTIDQVPSRFLMKNKISGNGNNEHLNSNGNFMLSVSATGFSEIIDMIQMRQDKKHVVLETGESYYGVKDMMENNQIIGFNTFEQGLEDALQAKVLDKKHYGIVRILNLEKYHNAKENIKSHGYKVIEYNGDTLKRNTCEIKTLNELANAPKENTVILIKGMCRMGKQVPKDHIAFVIESSNKPNADTILQGLLGRMCGYGQKNTNVKIYMNDYVFRTKELENYCLLNTTFDINHVPTHAKNICKRKIKKKKGDKAIIKTSMMEYFQYNYDEISTLSSHK